MTLVIDDAKTLEITIGTWEKLCKELAWKEKEVATLLSFERPELETIKAQAIDKRDHLKEEMESIANASIEVDTEVVVLTYKESLLGRGRGQELLEKYLHRLIGEEQTHRLSTSIQAASRFR